MSHAVSRTRRMVEIILAVGFLIAAFVYVEGAFHDKIPSGRTESGSEPVWTGGTAEARAIEVPVTDEAAGAVHARERTLLSARILGVVDRITVREGDRVKKGDLLVVLTAAELAAQHAGASSAVRGAEAAAEQARRQFERMDYLYRREAATKVEWEQARTAAQQADAMLAGARDAAGASGTLASYTRLTAPFAGVITGRNVDPGALASPGVPLLTLEADRDFRLEAPVDEHRADALRIGDSAVAVINSIGYEAPVTITEIVPSADPQSHTVLVKAALPADSGIRSGLFGRLRLSFGARAGIVVPQSSVQEAAGLATVRVVGADNVARARYVRTGQLLPDGTREILSGLAAGEKVALER